MGSGHFPGESALPMLNTTANHSQKERTMLKTFTFTVMHFCIAFGVAYALTGSVTVGGLVAAVEPLCNSVGFYFHEKIWQRLGKGTAQPSERPAHAWLHHHA